MNFTWKLGNMIHFGLYRLTSGRNRWVDTRAPFSGLSQPDVRRARRISCPFFTSWMTMGAVVVTHQVKPLVLNRLVLKCRAK